MITNNDSVSLNAGSLPVRIAIGTSILAISIVSTAPRFVTPGTYTSPNPSSVPRTYTQGSRLYLDNGTLKVGLEASWGGAIVELVWHGMNFVNAYDTGREVQVALYDGDPYPRGCVDCKEALGWNPVEGGDTHRHGSPLVERTMGRDYIYTKTRPYHWYPDNKGGGPNKPIEADVFLEKSVSFVADSPFGVKVHYKITHFGSDEHSNAFQEFPAVYLNGPFARLLYYGGETPWTNGPITAQTMPELPKTTPALYAPELWAALVNDQDVGLSVFVPGQYPYVAGFSSAPTSLPNSGTEYFSPRAFFSFGPDSVLEGDVYLFAGDYRTARQAIYSLHESLAQKDVFAPEGVVDQPRPNTKATGRLNVSGWAIHAKKVSEVDILVDDQFAGQAQYGLSRPDVKQRWSHAPREIGYWYTLETTCYSNGRHMLGVNAKDASGNVAAFSRIPIVIENPPSSLDQN